MYEELFYQRLIRLRSLKNVSAREMSLSIGQSPGYINSLENQKAMPSMPVFFYICDYFGVSPSEFFDAANPFPAELNEMMEILKELTPEQLLHLKYIAQQMSKNK